MRHPVDAGADAQAAEQRADDVHLIVANGGVTMDILPQLSGLDDQIAKLTQALGQNNDTALKNTTEPEGPIRIDNKGNLIGPYDIGRYDSVGNVAAPMSAPEDGKYATLGDAYAASVVGSAGADGSTGNAAESNSDPYAIPEKRQAQYTNPYDIPRDYHPNDYVYPTEQEEPYTNPYDIPREEYVWKYASEDEYIGVVDYDMQVEDLEAKRDKLDKEAYNFYKYLGDMLYHDKHAEYSEEYYKRIGEIEGDKCRVARS